MINMICVAGMLFFNPVGEKPVAVNPDHIAKVEVVGNNSQRFQFHLIDIQGYVSEKTDYQITEQDFMAVLAKIENCRMD